MDLRYDPEVIGDIEISWSDKDFQEWIGNNILM